MSSNPFRPISNCIPSRETERDWKMASAEAAGYFPEDSSRIPEECDLREGRPWWNISNQGQTGACVGFAVADSVLRWHFVQSKSMEETDLISVRYLWMASKETDEFNDRPTTFIENYGTSIKAALGIAYKYGVMLEKDLPFESGALYQGEEATFYAIAAKRRIRSYFNLTKDFDSWRKWIYHHGPIVVRLNTDESWINLFSHELIMNNLPGVDPRSGKLDTYGKGSEGHACAIVGYTKDRFIVRNSWGTEWGDNGYAYASDAYAKAAFDEAYGVVL